MTLFPIQTFPFAGSVVYIVDSTNFFFLCALFLIGIIRCEIWTNVSWKELELTPYYSTYMLGSCKGDYAIRAVVIRMAQLQLHSLLCHLAIRYVCVLILAMCDSGVFAPRMPFHCLRLFFVPLHITFSQSTVARRLCWSSNFLFCSHAKTRTHCIHSDAWITIYRHRSSYFNVRRVNYFRLFIWV